MSSFCSPSSPAIPFSVRRKSSSASTSTSLDSHFHGLGEGPSYLSPLSSSLLLTQRNVCMASQDRDFDHFDGVIYDQKANVEDDCHPYPLPHIYRPLPSLTTKFAAHALQSDPPLSYGQSPFYAPQITRFCPLGGSAISDDREEYDLESMDIHIRETYFATSAERGRWLSSPIAPRVRSRASSPMRGHSSPVKGLPDKSPPRERLRKPKTNCFIDKRSSPMSPEVCDEDVRYSSPLPPSSPLTSPVSDPSFLIDGYEHDSVIDPQLNSDNCHSLPGTPELSMSSSACTSPVQPTRTPTPPHEVPAIIPAHHPPCQLAGPTISRHTSPCSPQPTNLCVHDPGSADFESDSILSPLSQFELDLPEAEPPKLPLSDTVNKPYPGQNIVDPGVAADVAGSQDGPSFIQAMNSNSEPLDISLNTVGGTGSKKRVKREPCVANSGLKRSRKRGIVRSESPLSDSNEGKGSESRQPGSEPLSKKSKMSQCRDDLEGCGTKHPRRGGTSKTFGSSSSTVDGSESESACRRDKKARKLRSLIQPRQPTPGPVAMPVSMKPADVEFHASLTGMLIEALATSRATSMDASALLLVLTQAHPRLTAERSTDELVVDITTVLEAGRARCGMFEKVDCSGERTRHKALESRWFYVSERDEDPERASLISAIMPRQKRTETKKYKQYYYRPLDKISRWDPEDAP